MQRICASFSANSSVIGFSPFSTRPIYGPADAEQLGELVPTADLLLKPPQVFKRLVHRRGYWIGFLAQSLGSA